LSAIATAYVEKRLFFFFSFFLRPRRLSSKAPAPISHAATAAAKHRSFGPAADRREPVAPAAERAAFFARREAAAVLRRVLRGDAARRYLLTSRKAPSEERRCTTQHRKKLKPRRYLNRQIQTQRKMISLLWIVRVCLVCSYSFVVAYSKVFTLS
jgi:hypothetical protein